MSHMRPDSGSVLRRWRVSIVGGSRSGTSAFARLSERHADVATGIGHCIRLPLGDGPQGFPPDLVAMERFFA